METPLQEKIKKIFKILDRGQVLSSEIGGKWALTPSPLQENNKNKYFFLDPTLRPICR